MLGKHSTTEVHPKPHRVGHFLAQGRKESLLVCIVYHIKHVVSCWVLFFGFHFLWLKKNPPPTLAFRENFWLSPIHTNFLAWKVQLYGVRHVNGVWRREHPFSSKQSPLDARVTTSVTLTCQYLTHHKESSVTSPPLISHPHPNPLKCSRNLILLLDSYSSACWAVGYWPFWPS